MKTFQGGHDRLLPRSLSLVTLTMLMRVKTYLRPWWKLSLIIQIDGVNDPIVSIMNQQYEKRTKTHQSWKSVVLSADQADIA
ncbi:hypothetical protein F441_16723 [Phytophthora nicotianae CJ01A1]|uniref:Uncharacterized protein n=3 Tax=Phytophthora nicotianae TaxID=4792 RepID=W2YJQ4_PHYNI|nr:hypothetical protein L915_16415 [Phytophthora nicotianae]ETL84000.1 hypothetical protein L917_16121 [Phytophthora nicotianae]ETP06945.1 hypothetical protein F441_16723 [Phytophthora nicotianae CJ01A1]ETP35037.1 hypothetical protein F442_16717 [Phytophthora nicotianae P10297]